jgi:hypothetical protein
MWKSRRRVDDDRNAVCIDIIAAGRAARVQGINGSSRS